MKHKQLYDGLVPSHEANIFKHNILIVFPNRDQAGRRILLLELGSECHLNADTESNILTNISFASISRAVEAQGSVSG